MPRVEDHARKLSAAAHSRQFTRGSSLAEAYGGVHLRAHLLLLSHGSGSLAAAHSLLLTRGSSRWRSLTRGSSRAAGPSSLFTRGDSLAAGYLLLPVSPLLLTRCSSLLEAHSRQLTRDRFLAEAYGGAYSFAHFLTAAAHSRPLPR